MTYHDRNCLIAILEESNVYQDGDFNIESDHTFDYVIGKDRDEWLVILVPKKTRIYFLPMIIREIFLLQTEISICTDIDRPGCIVFH